MSMEIRPIFSALMRSKTGAVLVALQIAISLAILANALHVVNLRQTVMNRPSGIDDEASVFYLMVKNLPEATHEEELANQARETAVAFHASGVRARIRDRRARNAHRCDPTDRPGADHRRRACHRGYGGGCCRTRSGLWRGGGRRGVRDRARLPCRPALSVRCPRHERALLLTRVQCLRLQCTRDC